MEKRIYIRVPEQLLKDFDRACEANYTNKSEVLRRAMLNYVRENQKEAKDMFKLDIHEVATKEVNGYTVVDESAEWELVETIECETEEMCYEQANTKYDQENYHWTNPYLS